MKRSVTLYQIVPIISVLFGSNAAHFLDSPLLTPRLYNMPYESEAFAMSWKQRAVSINPTDTELIFFAIGTDETAVMEVDRLMNGAAQGGLAVTFQTNCLQGDCPSSGEYSFRTNYGDLPVSDGHWYTVVLSVITALVPRASYVVCPNDTADPCWGGNMVQIHGEGSAGPVPWHSVQGYEYGGQWDAVHGVTNGLHADLGEFWFEVISNIGDIGPSWGGISDFRDPITGRAVGLGFACSTPLSVGDPNACNRGNTLNFHNGPDFGGGNSYTLAPGDQDILPTVGDPCLYRDPAHPGQGCTSAQGQYP